ncbi:hypothetical protein IV203_036098 [Nitzschia inconspicua]|uniref:Uncharacterized protein n=1 Tax=Nitzschia inconspicua TaxID=303405 RepID=A0A9K3LFD9_9STRA|nr:hypothetical protein IV203_036098 [Nitzschia inconspicua]
MAVLPNIVGHHMKDTVTQFVPEEDSSGKHETSKEDGGDDLLPKKHPVLSMTTSSNPKYLHDTVHAKAHQLTIKNPPFPTSEPEKALNKPKGNKLPIKKPPPPPPPPVQPKEDDGNDLSQKQYPAFPLTTSSTTKHLQERVQTKAHQLAIKNPPFPTSAPEKALDKPKENKLLDEKAPPPPGRPQSNEDLGLSQNFKQLALLSANSSPKSTKPKKTGNSFKFKTSIIFKKAEILKEAKIASPAKKPKLAVVSSKNQDRQRIEEAIGLPSIQKANTELQSEFMVRGDRDVVPLEETTKSTNVRLTDHRNGDLRNMLPGNIQEKSRKKLGDGIPMIAKKGTVLGQDKLCKKTMTFGVQTVQPCKIVEKRHNLIFPGLTMGDEPRMKQSNKKRTDSKAEKKDGKDDYQDMAPKLLHCMKSEHLSLEDSRHRIVPTLRKAPPQHLLSSDEESPGQHIRPVSPTEILKQVNLGSNRASSGVEFGCRSVGKTSTITASSKQCASMFKDTDKNERIIQKQLGQCKTMQCRVEMLASPKRKGPSKHDHKPITKKKRSNESVGIKPFPTKAKQLKKQGYLSSFIETIKGSSGFQMTLATQTTKKRDENKNLHRMTVPEQQRHLQPQVEGTHKGQTGIETTSEVIEVGEKSKTKRSALEEGDKAAKVGRSCSEGIGNTSAYVLLKKTAKGTEESSKRTTTIQDQGQVGTEELVPKIPPEVSNIGQKEIKDIQIPKKRFMARIQQEQRSHSIQLSAMAPAGNKQPSKPRDEQFAEHSEDVSEETDLATISTKTAPKAFEINLVECTLTVNMPIPFSSGDKKPVMNEEKLGNWINNKNWTKFERLKEKAKSSEARSREFSVP